jgi:predicted nuclease of restriction endonuclease-like (RecB) superfamily/mono/diheme cytochrome c family protein
LQTPSAKSEILDKIFNGSVQEIGRTVSSQALKAMVVKPDILQALSTELASRFTLGWSHYVTLLTISNPDERRFYEIEARENSWGARELERQIASSLYERLALSRDKADIKALSQDGLVIENPTDVVKNPYVLEFLDLEEKSAYSEHEMETAIINRLEHFLLELGKGFLFDFLDAAAKCVSMAPDNRFKSMKIDTKTERLEMKKLITKFTMVMFLGIAASAYSQSREGQNTASRDYSSGRHVYESTCQFCHGVAGDGKGPAASALSPRPKDFTDPQFWKGMNNEKIAQTIRSGHGRGMPAFRFSSEDIKSVIDYMSHFKKGGGK